jgi:carbamoyl-phosphate synthase large subunit
MTARSSKRTDIKKIAVLGAGPIVIGQGCEFDYSGTQAVKVLRAEGYEVVLINSNPATIMTDPSLAHRTYIEPLTVEWLTRILRAEKPDALLPTLGGQTALNLATELHAAGVLKELGIELLGAGVETIKLAENREEFKNAMIEIGVPIPKSFVVHSIDEAKAIKGKLEFPMIIRAAFTLGGTGGSIAYNIEEFEELVQWGLMNSPVSEVLVEESVLGWKEIELEVMRDRTDQTVIICGIENLDPMGVHTGDSITVAPIQTLTDKEYQLLRDYTKAIMRKVGVSTGGSNVQFAVNPRNGRVVVIEMNPRVSRSSALASKATGFPIAKIAALLAVGYRLDEIKNEITGQTMACFEPTLDYVVTKIPRFNFEKFPQTGTELGPQMKSVGEVMAIGRTFSESFQKALRGMEGKCSGLDEVLRKRPHDVDPPTRTEVLNRVRSELQKATPRRIFWVAEAFRYGLGVDQVFELTAIDPWFLRQIRDLMMEEETIVASGLDGLRSTERLRRWKGLGFSDQRLSRLARTTEEEVRKLRWSLDVHPQFLVVDTCGGEFPSKTPYYYSTYQEISSFIPADREKKSVAIIGSGPNRIGQGLEFDYCCVHASYALREAGIRSVMLNCNPETVSTDYDTSDALYFEPLTLEDVVEVLRFEKISQVIVYFGGQTPLLLSEKLEELGYQLLGSSYDTIDLCEDRERFQKFLSSISVKQPASATATSFDEAVLKAHEVGFPLLARPSYVIGGRGMCVIHKESDLVPQLNKMEGVEITKKSPLLLDSFLRDAIEVDVDALKDRDGAVWIPGVMEHIEEAGVHSGDSTCSFPPYTLKQETQEKIRNVVARIVEKLKVVGLVNVQLAVQNREIFVLEVNPRASRTVPFLSKAIGVPLAQVATKLLLGQSFRDLGIETARSGEVKTSRGPGYAIKMPVFPFLKFPGVDPILGPEMKSTGEIMTVGTSFGGALVKALQTVFVQVPLRGGVFVSVRDEDKPMMIEAVRRLQELGFTLYATRGSAEYFTSQGISGMKTVKKVQEGRPHVLDALKNNEIHLVLNTTSGKKTLADAQSIRRAALMRRIPYFTTVSGSYAAIEALMAQGRPDEYAIHCLQEGSPR